MRKLPQRPRLLPGRDGGSGRSAGEGASPRGRRARKCEASPRRAERGWELAPAHGHTRGHTHAPPRRSHGGRPPRRRPGRAPRSSRARRSPRGRAGGPARPPAPGPAGPGPAWPVDGLLAGWTPARPRGRLSTLPKSRSSVSRVGFFRL